MDTFPQDTFPEDIHISAPEIAAQRREADGETRRVPLRSRIAGDMYVKSLVSLSLSLAPFSSRRDVFFSLSFFSSDEKKNAPSRAQVHMLPLTEQATPREGVPVAFVSEELYVRPNGPTIYVRSPRRKRRERVHASLEDDARKSLQK